tara:strand:+ start:488 stop:898 length:411 start_codon:yes stop_codon:yes gene_type:complete
MSRGRPSEEVKVLTKYIQVVNDVISNPELGEITTYHFDKDKAKNGPYKVEITYPKGTRYVKPKIEKGKSYGKTPVVMVFKTSERSNAKTKIKVWNNENIDFIISNLKLPGVPKDAIILELGVGESLIENYKLKYNL